MISPVFSVIFNGECGPNKPKAKQTKIIKIKNEINKIKKIKYEIKKIKK